MLSDLLQLVPDNLRQQALDALVDVLSGQAQKFAGDELANRIKQLRSDAAFQRAFEQGLERALRRFVEEYQEEDEDLVAAVAQDQHFFHNKEVQSALLAVLKRPGAYLDEEREIIDQSFTTVLPERRNRDRVNRAVGYLLKCLAEELWHLPELSPVYSLQFQRITAESAREQVAIQKAQLEALTSLNTGMREALLQLTDAIVEQKLLTAGGALTLSPPPKVYYNLPQPDYGKFVGREAELAQIHQLLLPHPYSRHFLVVIDGIGGIGKSALALEVAHHYLRDYNTLPAEERFEAIIWTSAKSSVLTADGVVSRRQVTHTLDDIYTAIAVALQREDITRARPEEQDEIVRQALTRQRTLLIVDNLETVDDENVLAFLRELPDPTKAVVTTRHRIDVAHPVRLVGMTWEDAHVLISRECIRKNATLDEDAARSLYDRTGGVPLALVWSVAQIAFGYSVNTVLKRLASPHDDIAQFCFDAIVKSIKNDAAYHLLLALSLFADTAQREALGFITEFSELDRDDGLAKLEKLSLANRQGGRFSLLPLTRLYCRAELEQSSQLKEQYKQKIVDYFVDLVMKGKAIGRYRALQLIGPESANILQLIDWCWENQLYQSLIKLISGIHFYLWISGEWHIDLRNLELGVQAAQEIEWDLARATFLIFLTGTLFAQNDYDRVMQCAEEAQRIYKMHDNGHILQHERERHLVNEGILSPSHGLCLATWRLGEAHMAMGHYDKAQELYEEALNLAQERNDRRNLIRTYQRYAVLDIQLENYEAAEEKLQRARHLREEFTQSSSGLSYTYSLLGQVAFHKKEWQEAQAYLNQALQMARDLVSPFDVVGSLTYLAMLSLETDEIEKARTMAEEARQISMRLGLTQSVKQLETLLNQM